MIASVLYVLLGFAVILGLVISFFFFTATIYDLLSIIFPFFNRFNFSSEQYFNLLYGSPKICCIIIFTLSSLFLLLFKFSYPYLFDVIRGVLS